jgi:hypothetical protein
MRFCDAAGAVGKGLVAGAIGTAAMTVSSTIEMKRRGRKPSDAPARAVGKVLGVEPVGEAERQRFSTIVHWAYGTLWGAARGLLGAAGVSGGAAAGAHFAAVWGSELAALPALGVTPPATQWGPTEVAIDAWHHLVYAAATNLAYGALAGGGRSPAVARR